MCLLVEELSLFFSPVLVPRLDLNASRPRMGQGEDGVLWAGVPHFLSVLRSPLPVSALCCLCSST